MPGTERGRCPACTKKAIYSRGVVQTERCSRCHSVFYRGIRLGKEPAEGNFTVEIISAGVLVMRGSDVDQPLTDNLRAQLAQQPHFVDPYGLEAAKRPILNAQAWWDQLPDKEKIKIHRANAAGGDQRDGA